MQIKKFLKLAMMGAFTSLTLLTSVQASLAGRDINGNAVAGSSAVFFYDSDLDITWLRNANVNGAMSWAGANAWAGGLTVGAFSDWRLPTTAQPDPTCSENIFGLVGTGEHCTGGEMGKLWYYDLNNSVGMPPTNTGFFQNLAPDWYWSETGVNDSIAFNQAYEFHMGEGIQSYTPKDGQFTPFLFAMAVRSGDVLANNAVPEPGTLLLTLGALVSLGMIRRRAIKTAK